MRGVVMLTVAILACAGCAQASANVRTATAQKTSPVATPSASPTPSPSPLASPSPVPPPVAMDVAFSGLPSGSFPTHLHSRCDGRAAFHITVLDNLAVAANGSGAVTVPTDYFGRGLCVVVYTNTSLTRVLAYRTI